MSFGHATMLQREQRLDKLRRASRAIRTDATLSWQNAPFSSTLPMYTLLRRQQKISIKGGWNKEFMLPMISEYSQLFGSTLKTSGGIGTGVVILENSGDFPSFPILTITGASQFTRVINDTVGLGLSFAAAPPSPITVDVATHVATSGGAIRNDVINFTDGWPYLTSGNNSWRIEGPGSFTVAYRDSWG